MVKTAAVTAIYPQIKAGAVDRLERLLLAPIRGLLEAGAQLCPHGSYPKDAAENQVAPMTPPSTWNSAAVI